MPNKLLQLLLILFSQKFAHCSVFIAYKFGQVSFLIMQRVHAVQN